MPAQQPKAFQLFGIISHEGAPRAFVEGALVVPYRDLGAVVSESAYLRLRASADRVAAYRRVVEDVFASRNILPAPFGTVFRSRDTLMRWFELHYFTLLDALAFIEDRVVARVRVSANGQPDDVKPAEPEKVLDVEASAQESFRVLRRHAVASLATAAHANPADKRPIVGASFLIERERWPQFADIVKEETKRMPALRIEQSGPWPPYDFIRMEFGG
jgi:hypothetical protein